MIYVRMRQRRRLGAANAFFSMRFFALVARTQWVVLSAAATQNRMRNACEAPKRRPQQAPTRDGRRPSRLARRRRTPAA